MVNVETMANKNIYPQITQIDADYIFQHMRKNYRKTRELPEEMMPKLYKIVHLSFKATLITLDERIKEVGTCSTI